MRVNPQLDLTAARVARAPERADGRRQLVAHAMHVQCDRAGRLVGEHAPSQATDHGRARDKYPPRLARCKADLAEWARSGSLRFTQPAKLHRFPLERAVNFRLEILRRAVREG